MLLSESIVNVGTVMLLLWPLLVSGRHIHHSVREKQQLKYEMIIGDGTWLEINSN